jgi:hypothetical protein
MVAVSLQLQALGGRRRDPRSTELLARLAATATESVGRLRQLVFELRPPLLDEVGLAAAIGQYATRAGELAGFVAQVTDESAGELPDELRVVAYRIVQEALANVRALREQAAMAGGWSRIASAPAWAPPSKSGSPAPRAREGDREACGDAGVSVRGRIPCLSGRSSRRRGPGRCR